MKKITSIEQLKKLSNKKNFECFISLAGCFRSSKTIYFANGVFEVFNDIDGTMQALTEKELNDEDATNVGLAIRKGALYAY